jgi:hypothetical protein
MKVRYDLLFDFKKDMEKKGKATGLEFLVLFEKSVKI